MKTTPFTNYHIQLGAKMLPFAGFNMPVEYTGINDEHKTVRQKAGLFDVSHMGEFRIEGPGAACFLQHITTNDINRLSEGAAQYSCMPNGKGGIVDDLLIYRFGEEKFMMVVNAANIDKDWDWCVYHAKGHGLEPGKGMCNVSGEIALLALQGPDAIKVFQSIADEDLGSMKFYTFRETRVAGIEAIVSATGYTGAGGCEIYTSYSEGPALWESIIEAGREFGLKPAGLGARDTLRLEMGYCLYGNDIDETTSPIEAGLGWITKFAENNDFIDREFLLKQKSEGPSRKLVGFIMRERGIPRTKYKIADDNGNDIGIVTSGTMSPMMNTGIGMGYVRSDHAGEGTRINILIRNKSVNAEVVRFPIYKKD